MTIPKPPALSHLHAQIDGSITSTLPSTRSMPNVKPREADIKSQAHEDWRLLPEPI